MANLIPTKGMVWQSGKVYNHSVGLSCCFRQWRSADSHCRFLHGYALKVEITFQRNNFAGELDDRNWVMNFGGLKKVKEYLDDTFDHKTLVALDDPLRPLFDEMYDQKLIQISLVENTGCEAFAKLIFDNIQDLIPITVRVEGVKVSEHEGNWAEYKRRPHNV